jgi:pimeloyl-ACP methyl ester carboxylesterase
MQKRPAPLVLLLPGIGGHRQGSTSVAVAETLFRGGCSVVTLSSAFHAEFMLRALTHPYPGYTPADVDDVRSALAAVAAAVDERWGDRVTEFSLLGYSLGGLQALFLAAGAPVPLPDGRHFTRVVAVNPPVDIIEAAQRFDRFYDIPLGWPQSERRKRMEDIALRAYAMATEGIPEGRPLPFSRDESQFLVGLGGRDALAAVLRARALSDARGARVTPPAVARNAVEAMNAVSFQRYLDELLLPACQASQPGATTERLRADASLRAVADALANDRRVRIVTNADDFVLGENGAQWLRQTFGADRVTLFPTGGHLGNLAEPHLQQAILVALGCAAAPGAGEPRPNAQ